MSTNLDSKDGTVGESCCNATWMAIVALTRAYGENIPDWNGHHDGYEWTPEHLEVMANRLEQTAELVPILRDLAKGGGVVIS